ncbi:MAG: hypothetical protein LAT68_02545 [Cyclobacteriaceae bacterium]|nr:hypothetical protein [Cyclobacteriaceae bacterium]MCH8515183.1 hypothetical protein [Cyclobacteriaceae bacterium]
MFRCLFILMSLLLHQSLSAQDELHLLKGEKQKEVYRLGDEIIYKKFDDNEFHRAEIVDIDGEVLVLGFGQAVSIFDIEYVRKVRMERYSRSWFYFAISPILSGATGVYYLVTSPREPAGYVALLRSSILYGIYLIRRHKDYDLKSEKYSLQLINHSERY